jgi:ATP-dependent HslUV protease ATP-binding subunit HslU
VLVELDSLGVEDFVKILTVPANAITDQYKKLLAVDNIDLGFTDDGIRRMAQIAFQVNEKTENIGARRLHTVIEKLLEEVSFDARTGSITIDAAYVDTRLEGIAQREDLARYIL